MRSRFVGPGKGPGADRNPSAAGPRRPSARADQRSTPRWARGSQPEPGAAGNLAHRPAVRADPRSTPRWARGSQADPSAELPASVAEALSGRLGFDVSQVRIHAGTQAAEDNRRLGSVAHTIGRDVFFSRDAYAPHTGAGQALLAHELTHVAQQLSGNTDTEDAQEREAESVAAGGSRRRAAFGTGTPALALRLSRGDALSIDLIAYPDGKAEFSALLEGGGTATASGTVHDLPEGMYWARMGPASLILTHDDGTPMAQTDFFNIPANSDNNQFVKAVTGSKTRMRLTVRAGAAASHAGGPAPADPYADLRSQLNDLPERIKAVLFSSGKGVTRARPEDYERLLRIADKLAELSDEELAEYAERTTRAAFDIAAFEDSVDAWVTQLTRRRAVDLEADKASAALAQMDSVYSMYRGWQAGLLMGSPPSYIADWEALPTSALPATHEGIMAELYLQMRRALQPFGYSSLRAFEVAIARFVVAFRESAITEAASLLDQYEHVLVREQARYTPGSPAVTSLHADLAPARASFAVSDEQQRHVLAPNPNMPAQAITRSWAASAAAERYKTEGRAQVRAQTDMHPLLGYENFPVDKLGRSGSVADTQQVLAGYITESLDHVADTRARLSKNHELVFKLDILVTRTKSHLGIEPGSIWDLIIIDHQAPTLDDLALETILTVLGIALAIASGGSAVAAVAALGLSSFMALQAYEDYALRSDAYGAQLLSEEPWMGWVVLAVVGVVADFGAVASLIRPIRPALRAFQESGDIAALEKQLGGVEERIRNSILARAELELEARRGWASIWEKVVPAGAPRASLGLDLLAEQIGKVVYSIQLNLRRGINTFTKWRLTREAADLIGDINRLSPAQIVQVRALYSQAIQDAQRIASHGRELGLTVDEMDAVVQNWARRGTGTVDDVLNEMTAARKARPAGEEGAWTPPSGWNGPSKYGRWTGARGNSGWIDSRPEVIRIVGRSADGDVNPIPFRQGEVDFGKWSQGELSVPGLVGEHAEDMTKIRLAIAERQGLLPGASRSQRAQAALDWLRNAPDGFGGTGLRPHHAGGDVIELIPKDLHKVQHTDLAIYDVD